MAEQKEGGGQSLMSRAREAAKTALPAVLGSASFGNKARNKAGLSVFEVIRDAIKRKGALKAGAKVASKPLVKKAKEDLAKLNQNFRMIKSAPDRLPMRMPRLVDAGFRTAGKLKNRAMETKASLEKFISANKGVKAEGISKAIKRKAAPVKAKLAPAKAPALKVKASVKGPDPRAGSPFAARGSETEALRERIRVRRIAAQRNK